MALLRVKNPDGSWSEILAIVGPAGPMGPAGPQGSAGEDGEDGGYYTPAVTQLSENKLEFAFTPSKTDMPSVNPVQVTLPAGAGSGGNVDLTGYATEQFVRDGYQPKGDYLESTALPAAINTALAQAKASGEFDGKDGEDGADGYTPQKGIDYFDGQPGKDGEDGKDGYTPVKGVDYFDGNPGKDGQDGYTPVKGTDYWTTADRQQMVTDVLAALPTAEGDSF